jgi:hypothetical protein
MISVAIMINGYPIMARSAVNQQKYKDGKTEYLLDDGTKIFHKPSEGAIVLAKMMLDEIKEQK